MKEINKEAVEPFKVYVRIRPLLDRELKQITSLNQEDPNRQIDKTTMTVENNTIYLKDPFNAEFYGKNLKAFSFDNIFTEKDQNKTIFDSIIKKLIENVLQGYNSTALAYGITGTGKTHTMFGDIYQNLNFEKGICMYSVDYLFDKITSDKDKTFFSKMSYLEIYNEQVIDLLTEKPSNEGIMIVEDPKKGVIVPELTQKIVSTSEEVLNYIILGNQRRTMGPTGQNQFSSRSHAILEISIEQRTRNNDTKEEMINSKMLFVDLAGSERGGLEKGIRREEGSNINKSLLALGNCINILSDKTKKGSFVPYRDSKLTRLLKDSLGGNIVTLMITCVSPSPMSYEETNSTLNYASRANKIEKKITRNVKEVDQYTAQYREIIVSLRAEIAQLKDIIRNQHLLLQLKPNDSFRDEPQLNLNNNNDYNRNQNKSILFDDFFNADEIEKLEYNRLIDEIMISNHDLIEKKQPILLNCNYEVYENFLKTNLANLTEEQFEDFESKMEALYFDKINLEERIKRGMKDSEINEKYTIIRTFYEKFIELINDKLIENIEQNMILKFNLKEILELNEGNCKNLKTTEDQLKSALGIDTKSKLEEDLLNYQKNIVDNEKERNTIQSSLDQNMRVKSLLKKLLFKFISNTQMKEIKELQENYTGLLNEKKELEIKNKKYQEFLNSVMKEKEEKICKIEEISSELEKMKRQLCSKNKRVKELEKQLSNMEMYNDNNLQFSTKGRINAISLEPIKKASIRKLIKYFDDCDIKSFFPSKLKKDRRSTSRTSKRVSHRAVTNNFISINLNQKVPTITAFIKGGDIYTNEKITNSIKETTLQKTNFKKNTNNTFKTGNNDQDGLKLENNNSLSNLNVALNNSSSIIKEDSEDSLRKNNSLLNLANNLKGNNVPGLTPSNSKKFTNHGQPMKLNKQGNFKEHNNFDIDAISLSAVPSNNEGMINSSALDVMNNVLSLEGLKGNANKKLY